MKKISLGLATLAASLAITPAVFAAENLGTVTILSSPACDDGIVSPTPGGALNADNVTLTYPSSEICLKYQPAQGEGNTPQDRPADKAWIGFEITAPAGTKDTAKFTRFNGSEGEFKSAIDSGDTASFWVGIDKDTLNSLTSKNEKSITYTYTFYWDGNTDGEGQTVNLVIDTTNITLEDQNGEEVFTPKDAADNIEAYEKAQEEANANNNASAEKAPEEENANPNTADPVALYATIAAVALLGLGATALIAKKSRR